MTMAMARLQHRALYFITPSASKTTAPTDLPRIVKDAIRGGAGIVQWRQKPSKQDLAALPELREQWERNADTFLLPIAREIREITRRHGALMVVNDSLELALTLGADGVHIGQSDSALADVMAELAGREKDLLVGVTVRDGDQTREACRGGASYVGAGPVFSSSTKPGANDGITIGLGGLKDCTSAASKFGVPVYAIGGIAGGSGRVQQCVGGCGASGVAVVAAVSSASDKVRAAQIIHQELHDAFDHPR